MRLLEFSPSNNEIRVKTYSPTLDQYETDSSSEFTLNAELGGGIQVIGTDLGVPSGSIASVNWNNLTEDTVHNWYVEVADPTARSVTSATGAMLPGSEVKLQVALVTLRAVGSATSTYQL